MESYLENVVGKRLYESASQLAADENTRQQLQDSDTMGLQKIVNILAHSEDTGILILDAGARVVACSSDDEYAEAVPQIAKLVGDKAIVVVAGDPACKEDLMAKGIENFISVRSNVLHTLEDYQAKLGIK